MSLRVNMEPGGIISQMRQHMASSPDTTPLDNTSDRFDGYVADMIYARKERDNLSDQEIQEYANSLLEQSSDNPFGRELIHHSELSNGSKQLSVYMTLLNEAVGIMPDYRMVAKPGVRKIGRVTIVLTSFEPHSHTKLLEDYPLSQTMGGFDVLTDGSVNISTFALDTCKSCDRMDLSDDIDLMNRFGLQSLYMSRRMHMYESGEKLVRSSVHNLSLGDDHVTSLQAYLHERFDN